MKSFIIALILPISFFTLDINLDAIVNAIRKGDAQSLGTYLNTSVDISILDVEKTYSKNEAIKVIGDFFKKNPPSNFTEIHKGTSKGKDSHYCIGNLDTNNNSYRVYIYLKKHGSQYLIEELSFDEE